MNFPAKMEIVYLYIGTDAIGSLSDKVQLYQRGWKYKITENDDELSLVLFLGQLEKEGMLNSLHFLYNDLHVTYQEVKSVLDDLKKKNVSLSHQSFEDTIVQMIHTAYVMAMSRLTEKPKDFDILKSLKSSCPFWHNNLIVYDVKVGQGGVYQFMVKKNSQDHLKEKLIHPIHGMFSTPSPYKWVQFPSKAK